MHIQTTLKRRQDLFGKLQAPLNFTYQYIYSSDFGGCHGINVAISGKSYIRRWNSRAVHEASYGGMR